MGVFLFLGMKIKAIFLFFILSQYVYCQNIDYKELNILLMVEPETLHSFMLKRGFEFKKNDVSNLLEKKYLFERFSRNIDEIEKLEVVQNNKNISKKKIHYSFSGEKKHKNVVSDLINNGFEFIDSTKTNKLIINMYSKKTTNDKLYEVVTVYCLENYFYSVFYNFIPIK